MPYSLSLCSHMVRRVVNVTSPRLHQTWNQSCRGFRTTSLDQTNQPNLYQDTTACSTKSVKSSKVRFLPPRPKRIVVGITGATGTPYAIRLLEILKELDVETHLIISKWALATLKYECSLTESQIRSLAHSNYTSKDMSAPIASGSFQHDGMVVVPCSMKTLAAIRIGFGDELIARAADVSLKENRKLVLAIRETPLNDIHLDNMLFLRRAGAVIFPPVPAFYTRPKSLEEVVDQSVGRMLDMLGFKIEGFERWDGFRKD
ncbi:hypothetical protein HYE68_002760 [Fusarium pseudograminearum]|nr:hypothetical protein HYE68_002760 [Fusarium pseudograminearum]